MHLDYYFDAEGNAEDWCHLPPPERTYSKTDGVYGDYRCDSSKLLVNSAIDTMQIAAPNPDIILWTGDTSPHWNPKWDYIYKVEREIIGRIKRNFPNSKILPVLGNHDSYPPYTFPGTLNRTVKI